MFASWHDLDDGVESKLPQQLAEQQVLGQDRIASADPQPHAGPSAQGRRVVARPSKELVLEENDVLSVRAAW